MILKLILRTSISSSINCQGMRMMSHAESLKQSTKSTVDIKEINHHSNYANEWWNLHGLMGPLHSLNQLRVPFIRDCLINNNQTQEQYSITATPLKDVKVLEVGCGGGILTEPLARLGAMVTGLDAAKDLINVAISHLEKNLAIKPLIEYKNSTIEDFSVENRQSYDAVVCSEVIEHVTNKDVFLKATIDTLKPGGSVFITTFDKTFPAWLGSIALAEYVFNLVPKGTHEYEKFISPHELQRMLELNNCTTRIVQGMVFNPLLNKWHWIPYNISYALHAVKD